MDSNRYLGQKAHFDLNAVSNHKEKNVLHSEGHSKSLQVSLGFFLHSRKQKKKTLTGAFKVNSDVPEETEMDYS